MLGARSMLQDTVRRARALATPARTLVLTTQELAPAVRCQLPEIPAKNVIGEPVGRNTAACIGLAAIKVVQEDPDGLMVVLPADHLIQDLPAFRRAVRLAADLAAREHLVTIGIPPSRPETGYGYIEWGAALGGTRGQAAWAASFTEKPPPAKARRFVASGRYLWNSGIFAWRARRILEEVDRFLPALRRCLEKIRPALGGAREARALRRYYARLPSISIDYGILERVERVAVVRGRFRWSDLGSWAAMEGLWRGADGDGNALEGPVLAIGARGCVASSRGRLVALCGVDDLVVVEAPDAVLVCRKSRAQDVRLVVRELERRRLHHLL
jgi:mannose-1-phosphate guanylyltransferase